MLDFIPLWLVVFGILLELDFYINEIIKTKKNKKSPEIIYKITNDTTKWTTAIGVGGNELWIIMN